MDTFEFYTELFNNGQIAIRKNNDLNGFEFHFANKNNLSPELHQNLKSHGFRWSPRNHNWYHKVNDVSENFVKNFIKENSLQEEKQKEIIKENEPSIPTWDYKKTLIELRAIKKAAIELAEKTNTPLNFPAFQETILQQLEQMDNNDLITSEQIATVIEEKLQNTIKFKEKLHESTESNTIQMGKSGLNREHDFRRGNSRDAQEFDGGVSSAEMDGISRQGYARNGYGNSIQNGKSSSGISLGGKTAIPVDNSFTDGQVRERSIETDRSTSGGIHSKDLREGELVEGLSELSESAKQLGYGDVEKTQGSKEQKRIRAEIKTLLENKTDKQLTLADIELLKLYEGGGGLKEIDVTAAETLNAFYTPHTIILKTWELVDALNPHAKTVLEPSSGIGRFAENRPNNEFTLRELDETSSRIARILHPKAEIIQGAFQAQFFDNNGIARLQNYTLPQYDVVIGNPPYGLYSGEWKGKGEGKEFSYIDEYFIAKGLESTKEGGTLAFVMPSGFLKRHNEVLAETLSKDSLLVDAWRLPNGVFPTTDVGTDIVVFKKLTEDEKKIYPQEKRTAILLGDEYFKQNPNHILGQVKTRSGRFGKVDYVAVPENETIQTMLNKIKPNLDYLKIYEVSKPIVSKTTQIVSKVTAIENKVAELMQQKLPYVEQVYQSVVNPPESNPFINNTEFNKIYEIESDVNFEKMDNRFWRSDNSWALKSNTYLYFDIATRCSAIAISDSNNKKKLIAAIDKDGKILKLFSNEDYNELTKNRKDRLQTLFDLYAKENSTQFTNAFNLAHAFIDIQDGIAYFKNIEKRESNYSDRIQFFNSSTNTKVEFDSIKYAIDADKARQINGYRSNISLGNVFFAQLSTLYPKSSEVNFKQVLKDDSVIRLAGNNIKEALEKEFFSINGIKDFEELKKIISEKRETIARVRLAKREEAEKQAIIDYSQNELFNQILLHGISVISEHWKCESIDDFIANNSHIRLAEDTENKNTVNIYIDYKRSFAINEKEKSLQTFNNFYVTKEFVKTLYENFGNELYVNDKAFTEVIVSLNKELLSFTPPKVKLELGEKVAMMFIEKVKDGFKNSANEELKKTRKLDFDSPVFVIKPDNKTEFLCKLNGTHSKLFASVDSNYPMFDFDKQTNILHFYQQSFEEGYLQSFEKVFKTTFKNLSIVKDITINNQRYVDTDGVTIKANPLGKVYEPVKSALMDNKDFADIYGKNWNPQDRLYWEATDYKGYVDTSKLTQSELNHLKSSENYVEETHGNYIHKELFASGNIYEKIQLNLEHFHNSELDENMYQKNKVILENAIPIPYTIKEINQSVKSPFVEFFELDGIPIKEKFLQWATGSTLEDSGNKRNHNSHVFKRR